MAKKASNDELLEKLREFHRTYGRSPSVRDFPGGSTIEKHFGSWNAALKAANLPLNKVGKFSDQDLLDKLRVFYQEHGRAPTLDELPGAATIEQRFGSWNNALTTAGLQPNKKNEIPDEALLERLRAFHREHGRSPTFAELPGATTILVRFGGWNNALRAAKLPLNVPKYHLTKGQVGANTIRDTARVMYIHYHGEKPTRCRVCGYDKSIMICHIKPVAEFDDTATIEEINAKSNLIALCPNCHRELDDGWLQLPQ
ncbi:MAG: HNH endonuclease [Anaerolineae bacterium]